MTSFVSTANLTTAPIVRLGHSAKFYLPPRPPDVLRRQRLIDFLHENSHRKVILISAAAGYGKSTLLVDFAHDVDYPVAWCRLDEADGDVTVLAASLATALQQTFPVFQAVVHELSAQPPAKPEQLAATLQHGIASGIDE